MYLESLLLQLDALGFRLHMSDVPLLQNRPQAVDHLALEDAEGEVATRK